MRIDKMYLALMVLAILFSACSKEHHVIIETDESQDETNKNSQETDENSQEAEKTEDAIDLTSVNFTLTSIDIDLPQRVNFEMVNFNNQFFFMGGRNVPFDSETFHNDIWRSEDGIKWTKIKDNAAWNKRHKFNLFEFDKKLWIIGGVGHSESEFDPVRYNDVWCSEDGLNWTKVLEKGPWEKRGVMNVSVLNNKMYLTGGKADITWKAYRDVWESSDGVTWRKVGSIGGQLLLMEGVDPNEEGIWDHTVTNLNGTNFLIGGYNTEPSFHSFKRVLKSTDMINWEIATLTPPWKDYEDSEINNIRPFVYHGNLMVVVNTGLQGHILTGHFGGEKHVFFTRDGVNWQKLLDLAPDYRKVHKPRTIVNGKQIYIYGYKRSIELDTRIKVHGKMHLIQLTQTISLGF